MTRRILIDHVAPGAGGREDRTTVTAELAPGGGVRIETRHGGSAQTGFDDDHFSVTVPEAQLGRALLVLLERVYKPATPMTYPEMAALFAAEGIKLDRDR